MMSLLRHRDDYQSIWLFDTVLLEGLNQCSSANWLLTVDGEGTCAVAVTGRKLGIEQRAGLDSLNHWQAAHIIKGESEPKLLGSPGRAAARLWIGRSINGVSTDTS